MLIPYYYYKLQKLQGQARECTFFYTKRDFKRYFDVFSEKYSIDKLARKRGVYYTVRVPMARVQVWCRIIVS